MKYTEQSCVLAKSNGEIRGALTFVEQSCVLAKSTGEIRGALTFVNREWDDELKVRESTAFQEYERYVCIQVRTAKTTATPAPPSPLPPLPQLTYARRQVVQTHAFGQLPGE